MFRTTGPQQQQDLCWESHREGPASQSRTKRKGMSIGHVKPMRCQL